MVISKHFYADEGYLLTACSEYEIASEEGQMLETNIKSLCFDRK